MKKGAKKEKAVMGNWLMMAMDSSAVTPRETFSVLSPVVEWGVKKPTMVTTVMKADGITKLRSKYFVFLSIDAKNRMIF